jgi:carboxyl-terminal processing protease
VPIGSNEEEAVESMDNLGFLSFFVFEHLEEDRDRYANYSQEEYVNDFKVDDILFEKFVEYSVNRNLRMNFYDHEQSIKRFLKASIAEQLFNTNIHAKIKADEDPMLQKVLELDSNVVQQQESSLIKANN